MPEFEQQTRKSQLLRPAGQEQAETRPILMMNPLLDQQQALGNQAMQQFAQSCPLSLPGPGLCPTGGVCHTCPVVQTKLKIGQPGDKYEQEADRVAEQVMQMPEPRLQRQSVPEEEEEEEPLQTKPLADQITPLIQRQSEPEEEKEEEEEPLQTKAISGRNPKISPNVQAQITALRGGGHPLPRSARQFFEPRFGYDFGQVRIHTSGQAPASARSIKARAFTIGDDIVFAAGEYSPGTRVGKKLLAHELTHIVQQTQRPFTERMVQRACQFFPSYSSPDIYCQNRDEAVAQVTRACPPYRACFIRRDGPPGYRWRRNPGYGCAHHVAHRLNISNGPRRRRCFAGRTLTITDLIAGRTSYPLSSASVNDIWTTGTHAGVVIEVGAGNRAGHVRVEHCTINGTVSTDWKIYGNVYR